MAKQPKRRGSRGFQPLPFTTSKTLLTLADNTAVLVGSLGGNLTEDYFVISLDATWAIRGMAAGQGPIDVGVAHGDYTVTEIKEWIELNLLGPANKIQQEKSRRLIRKVGTFSVIGATEVLADGRVIRTKMRWIQDDGQDLNVWAFNRSGAPLTTGGLLEVSGKYYGRWVY